MSRSRPGEGLTYLRRQAVLPGPDQGHRQCGSPGEKTLEPGLNPTPNHDPGLPDPQMNRGRDMADGIDTQVAGPQG